jgi:hypothetical protein
MRKAMLRYWKPEVLLDYPLFKRETLRLLYESQIAFRSDDFEGMWHIMEVMDEAAPLAKGEPFISTYDYTYSLVALNVGITLANYCKYSEAVLIAEYVHARWLLGQKRRAECGIEGVKHSEVRVTLLNLLGHVKTLAPHSFIDRCVGPASMAAEMRELADHIFTATEPLLELDPAKAEMLREAVGWAYLQNIKMGLRLFTPSKVAGMISHFNRLFGYKLAAALNHWDTHGAPDPDCCFYYELEIYKLHFAGTLTGPVERELWNKKEAAAKRMATAAHFDLRHYLTAASADRGVLRSGFRLEVLNAEAG